MGYGRPPRTLHRARTLILTLSLSLTLTLTLPNQVRWDLGDRFMPEGGRWLSEFNASHRAVGNCQR
jgi:hypothetical protein